MYRSRIWAPCGRHRDRRIEARRRTSWPRRATLTPRPTRSSAAPTIAAPTARAKIAVWRGRATWGSSTSRSSRWATRRHVARRPMTCSRRGRPPGPNRGHATRSACVSRAQTGSAATLPTTAPMRSCDDAADGRSSLDPRYALRWSLARSLAALAAAVPVAGPRPRPDRAADARLAAPRLDVRAAPDPRPSRWPSAAWLWAVRRVDAAHPAQPGPAPADRGVPGRDAGARVRPAVRHRALRHDAVLDPHGPARPADARGGAAHRARGARSRCCCGSARPRRAAAGSCRCSTRASCASSATRSWRG